MPGRSALDWEVITPPKFNAKAFEVEVRAGMLETGKNMKKLFQGTVSTWDHKPKFERRNGVNAQGPWSYVYTYDRIYGFINFGTVIRYATMTNPFTPKTSPGSLTPGPGIGGLLFVSRKRPRPGIKARDFVSGVADLTLTFMVKEFEARMLKARNASGHAYP